MQQLAQIWNTGADRHGANATCTGAQLAFDVRRTEGTGGGQRYYNVPVSPVLTVNGNVVAGANGFDSGPTGEEVHIQPSCRSRQRLRFACSNDALDSNDGRLSDDSRHQRPISRLSGYAK